MTIVKYTIQKLNKNKFITIWLDSLLQLDDDSAFREISRQLSIDNNCIFII